MKKIVALLLVLFTPVAFSQEFVVKKGQRYTVITTDCEGKGAAIKVTITRIAPGKFVRVYTTHGSERCRIKAIKTLA